MFEKFIQRYKNAKKVVAQIKNGEYIPQTNEFDRKHYHASSSDGIDLWIANAWSLTIISGTNYSARTCPFGTFWRHYVWWFAARKLKKDADNSTLHKVPVL